MKRRYRIMISAFIAVASVGLVALLILLGTATEGPLGSALESVGDAVRSAESRVARRLRGPGRAESMKWLEPMRVDTDALRSPERVLLGAYDDGLPGTLGGVLELEDALGVPLPLIQIYSAWGDRADQRFPRRIADAIAEIGSVPVITWEPWLTDFENSLHPDIPLRDQRERGGLADIAAGTYDFYIDAWAEDAIRFGRPVLVRFAHEMNDSYRYPWGPQNNRPEDFIAAWRHVVQRFRDAGAGNVLWVWAPHIAYEGYEAFYPGDDVVDWVATGTLNYGAVANWSQWWTFEQIFGQRYPGLAGFGKPIMIAEFGSLAVGGDRAAWYEQALTDLPERFPDVRALLFFNVGVDRTVTYQALDWSILEDSATIAATREALRSWPDTVPVPR